MKILLVNDYLFEFGGAEEIFFNTKKLLEEKGHEVRIFGSKDKGILPPISVAWFSIKYYTEIKKIIKDFKPDIVHVHACIRKISPSVLVAIKTYNLPIIMTFHDFDILGPKSSLIYKKNFRFIRKIKLKYQVWMIKKYSDYFICPSRKLTEEIKKSFSSNTVSYIPNFYEIQEEKYLTKKTDSKRFIFIGRLENQKGVDIAIKAVGNLVKAEGLKDILLYIIGDGAAKSKLLNLVNSLNLQSNIKFLGKIPNKKLSDFYKTSQAVLIPSVYMENSPLVAYEAMNYKKPIIASNIGGLPDLVVQGKNGFLFKMGDINELSYYIIKLFKNISLSNKLGSVGYQKVVREFNKEVHYKNLIKIYSKFVISN